MILSSPQPSGDMVAMECMLFECAERGARGGWGITWAGLVAFVLRRKMCFTQSHMGTQLDP